MAKVRAPARDPGRASAPSSEAPEPRSGMVLLVEDYHDVRTGLSQLLEMHGFHVAGAADAEQAIACLTSRPASFALVLLDLLLPGISGETFRHWQLADPGTASIPTVVVTSSEPQAETVATLRPANWLEKPFRGDDLLKIVRRYVTPDIVPKYGT
jgi:CheY-like chemotaxis protein